MTKMRTQAVLVGSITAMIALAFVTAALIFSNEFQGVAADPLQTPNVAHETINRETPVAPNAMYVDMSKLDSCARSTADVSADPSSGCCQTKAVLLHCPMDTNSKSSQAQGGTVDRGSGSPEAESQPLGSNQTNSMKPVDQGISPRKTAISPTTDSVSGSTLSDPKRTDAPEAHVGHSHVEY